MLFPVGINQSYAQTNHAIIVPPLVVANPTITVPLGTTELTIPFGTIVTVADNTFDELTITFALGPSSVHAASTFSTFTGTTPSALANSDTVLTVDAESVVITTTLIPAPADVVFEYIVVAKNGRSGTGMITIEFVSNVLANPHTVTLPNLDARPIFDLPISLIQINDILLAGTGEITGNNLNGFVFTTNGTGNATGTMTVTNISSDDGTPIFHYTPTMFGITETFEYTATRGDNSGTSQLSIVVPDGVIVANPHTVSPDFDIFEPMDLTISLDDIITTLLVGSIIFDNNVNDIVFTIANPGNGSGTLTVNPDSVGSTPVFHYTSALGFAGTETFEYTATRGESSGTSQLLIVVPSICRTLTVPDIDFGALSPDQESDDTSTITISNTGNQAAQPLMHATNWISDVHSDVTVMNVNQTRYSLSDTAEYDAKTSLTDSTAPASVGTPLPFGTGDDAVASVYLQLLVNLLPDALLPDGSEFRGPTTQIITVVGSNCSD